MRIVGVDRTDYGTVERFDDDVVYVGGRPVPYSAFDRIDEGRLYLRERGVEQLVERPDTFAPTGEGEIRVPLVEERLQVGTRAIELGDVEIRKVVESEPVSVPIEVRRDRIDVRQVDVEERPIRMDERMDAFTEAPIRVPVRGEEVIVTKEAVVTAEVEVGRTHVSERQTVTETVRHVSVDVAASYDKARPDLREHFDRLQARLREAGGPTFRARDFADAEPNYRAGFEAHGDPRNAGRSFADVEPELRRQHDAGGTDDPATWKSRREEFQAGWEHGRR
jgi:uncharacterized protein (TIGR02271 family)